MSSTDTGLKVADTRTDAISARPSGALITAGRPNVAEPPMAGPGLTRWLASGSPVHPSTVTSAADETHSETLACGVANRTISTPPASTTSARSLSWPGRWTDAQGRGAAAAAATVTVPPQNWPLAGGALRVAPAPA